MNDAFPLMSFRSTFIAVSILTFINTPLCLAQEDDRACYDNNNNLMPTHRPCVSPGTKAISHCCSTVDTCLADTLCLSQWGTLWVGSCTVKVWAAGTNARGDCPKYRTSQTYGSDIGLCTWEAGVWKFCCGPVNGIANCCAGDTFILQGVTNQYLDQRPWTDEEASTRAASPSASPTASSTTGASVGATAVASHCSSPVSKSQSKSNTGAQIGLGVGLGIPLLIALGLLIWENRKRRHAEAQITPHNAPGSYSHPAAVSTDYAHAQMYATEERKAISEMPSPPPAHELADDMGGYVQRGRT